MSRTLGYSALIVWLGHFYFWYSYFESGLKPPNYADGHIIPLNIHGSVHYLTVGQDQYITVMEIAAFALFAVGFLIQEYIVRPRKPQPWEKKQL